MGYLLYGANGSGSCVVEAVLAEIDADYELKPVDVANHAQRDAHARDPEVYIALAVPVAPGQRPGWRQLA